MGGQEVSSAIGPARGTSPRGLRLLIAGLLAANAVVVVSVWLSFVATPHLLENTESNVLSLVLWWKQGQFPYSDATALPVLGNPYGPLYLLLCKLLPTAPESPYLAGRLLSVVSMLAALALVYFWVERRTQSVWASLVAALLPLTARPLLQFGPLYRVDNLALALTMAGLCLTTLGRGAPSLVAGAAFFVAAFATKATYVAAPAACVAYVLLVDRRRGLRLGALLALGFSMFVVSMEWATGGYLLNVAQGNVPSILLKAVEIALLRPMLSILWILALVQLARSQPRRSWLSVASLYTLAAWMIAAFFGLNHLSSWNFLLELYLALALLSGELLARSPTPPAAASKLLLAHALLSFVLLGVGVRDQRQFVAEYRPVYERARATLSELIVDGRRVVVIESLAGRDALNGLGRPNLVTVPSHVDQRPEVLDLLRRGEQPFLVLFGDELEELD